MLINLLAKVLLFVGLVSCKSLVKSPAFSWLGMVSQDGIPLLNIKFPDGGDDDVAILKYFNPIPQGANERSEDIDLCIYDGYLQNEKDVYVTLTGCALTETFQIQFKSSRLSTQMFSVKNGEVEHIVDRRGDNVFNDYIEIPDALKTIPNKPVERATLSMTGYIITLKVNYDDNWNQKFGADSINAMRRCLAHAQNMWMWPSAPSKMIFKVDPDVRQLPGTWTASGSIEAVSVNNVDSINTNIYFCVRNAASGKAFGVAYLGGGCLSSTQYKTVVMEWDHNDLVVARSLAHEIAHSTGVDHDFKESPTDSRLDSTGKRCLGQGGIMDYSVFNENDKSRWSTCSIEDYTKMMTVTNTTCLTPITETNLPASTAAPPLTVLECQLGPSFASLNGAHNLRLNGYETRAMCVNGVCAANAVKGVTNACVYLCGSTSCLDAVDPGVCDMTKLLPGYSGAKYTCINGKQVAVRCTNGICTPYVRPFTNSCVGICGQTNCDTATDTCPSD